MSDDAIAKSLAPTGVLRASINLGNPVLAQGSAEAPAGVTVDIARRLAERLGVPASFQCFDAARASYEALRGGGADIAFLADEPARAAEVWFTRPYVLIEGVFAVPSDSAITNADAVDRPGIRIGVKDGSAYDLFLTRTVEHAEVVRGREGVDVFRERGLEVAAGIRQPITRAVAEGGELRLVEPAFMQIRQAVATTLDQPAEVHAFLDDFIAGLKGEGFIAESLERAGQDPAVAAPAA